MVNQLNALHAAINEEIADVYAKNSDESVNSSRASYVYGDGSVVFPVEPGTCDSGIDLVGSNDEEDDHEHINRLIGESDSMVRDGDILKVPNANLKILASYAKMFTDDENMGTFYGMVIVDNGKKINPLHPIIASMIMTKEIILSDTFAIIVYPYRAGMEHTPSQDIIDEYSSSLISIMSKIRDRRYLPNIKHMPREPLEEVSKKALINGVEHCSITFRETGNEVREAIIPVQLATRVIVYPYYGMIRSSKSSMEDSAYNSGNCFPMLSGNVDSYSVSPGSTCVGELSNRSFSSLYVLSNMNILSMYFHDILRPGYKNFVCACQLVSAAFLGFAAGIDPLIEQEEDSNTSSGASDISEDVIIEEDLEERNG